jgi:hypothetical protein
MNYDLLVIDLDGTLLARDGSVSERNRTAISAARAGGIEVIIATGRALAESRSALRAIDHDGLLIAAGGSLLCDVVTGRTLDRRAMSREVVADVARHVTSDGHRVLILKDAHATGYDYLTIGESDLDPASKWWFAQLDLGHHHIACFEDDPHPDDSVRAGAVACESRLGPLASIMRKELGERCFLQHWSAVTASHAIGSSTHLLEVFMPNVNKWTMVESYCQRMQIDPRRVAAIGDGLNDVELVRDAGLGIAMANAGPEVLAHADRITDDHESDGVALAIEQILAGHW